MQPRQRCAPRHGSAGALALPSHAFPAHDVYAVSRVLPPSHPPHRNTIFAFSYAEGVTPPAWVARAPRTLPWVPKTAKPHSGRTVAQRIGDGPVGGGGQVNMAAG